MKPSDNLHPTKKQRYSWLIIDNNNVTYYLHSQTRYEASEELREILKEHKDLHTADLYKLPEKPVISGAAHPARDIIIHAV